MTDTLKLQEAADGGCPPATCSALRFSTVDELREHVEGRWTLKKCPKCSARLLTNNAGDEWCSYVHCDYGCRERHEECGHEKVSVTNGHCSQCDVVCPRCNGTGDLIIEKHICDCPDCFPQNEYSQTRWEAFEQKHADLLGSANRARLAVLFPENAERTCADD